MYTLCPYVPLCLLLASSLCGVMSQFWGNHWNSDKDEFRSFFNLHNNQRPFNKSNKICLCYFWKSYIMPALLIKLFLRKMNYNAIWKYIFLRIWWEMRDLDMKAMLSTSVISFLLWRLFQILKSIKCYRCFLLLFEKDLYLDIEIQNIWKNKFNIAISFGKKTETDSLCKTFQVQYLLFKVTK